MWEGFTNGLSNLGSNIGNMFSNTKVPNTAFANLPSMENLGVNTVGLGTTPVEAPNMFAGMGKYLTSKSGQGLLKTGMEGFNSLNQYKLGKNQMNIANRQMGMSEDAYARDKKSAEARQNLRF